MVLFLPFIAHVGELWMYWLSRHPPQNIIFMPHLVEHWRCSFFSACMYERYLLCSVRPSMIMCVFCHFINNYLASQLQAWHAHLLGEAQKPKRNFQAAIVESWVFAVKKGISLFPDIFIRPTQCGYCMDLSVDQSLYSLQCIDETRGNLWDKEL